jgi:LPXTG-motif cell wall-anchored protein
VLADGAGPPAPAGGAGVTGPVAAIAAVLVLGAAGVVLRRRRAG